MDLETISVAIFLGIVALIIFMDRKNIEFKYGLITRRTKKGRKLIYDFSDKHRKKLIMVGNIAIIAGIIASIFGIATILRSTYFLIFKPEEAVSEVKLVFPSVSGIKLPGFVLGVPFWYWIIGVFVVLFTHEPMHAFMARAEKVTIKSFGLLLFIILPGAFVDPDEKQIKKLSMVKKLRIYAGGSFGNLIAAGFFLALLLGYSFIIESTMLPKGIIFEKTIANSGAEKASLKGIINQINNVTINSTSDFTKAMENVKPGDIITIKTTEGSFEVKTTKNPDDPTKPFIGIEKPRTFFVYKGVLNGLGTVSDNTLNVLSWIFGLLGWVFSLNIGIGVFNLFPIKPLDGGLMFEEIVKHFYKGKKAQYIVNFVSLFVLALVLINLFGPGIISWVKGLLT
jgi:membrane-associated protease RseP (regulator of RpoE activity)